MIIIDSVVRLVPGVINNIESALTDSFAMDLLDSPCYTQPRDIEGLSVPEVLLSGNHKEIDKWKQDCRAKRTEEKRPDMWKNYIKINKSELKDE
jgi:tRNA (guanine37-N1)-methyltransferase